MSSAVVVYPEIKVGKATFLDWRSSDDLKEAKDMQDFFKQAKEDAEAVDANIKDVTDDKLHSTLKLTTDKEEVENLMHKSGPFFKDYMPAGFRYARKNGQSCATSKNLDLVFVFSENWEDDEEDQSSSSSSYLTYRIDVHSQQKQQEDSA